MIFKKTLHKYYSLDPTYQHLTKGIVCSLPNCIAIIVAFALHLNPFSCLLMAFTPTYILQSGYDCNTWKERFYNMGIAAFLYATIYFGISALNSHQTYQIIFITFVTFIGYYKFRSIVNFVFPISTLIFDVPQGWYIGSQYAIEQGIAFIISFLVLYIFKYYFSIYRMKIVLIAMTEAIDHIFILVTQTGHDKTLEKGHRKGDYLFRDNVRLVVTDHGKFVSKVFYNNIEKLEYKLSNIYLEANKNIHIEQYFMYKNKIYAAFASELYSELYSLFRCMTFLYKLKPLEKEINSVSPSTFLIIDEIRIRINSIIKSIKENNPNDMYYKYQYYSDWQTEIKNFKSDPKLSNKEKIYDLEKIFYGITCFLNRIQIIENLIVNKMQTRQYSKKTKEQLYYAPR
ncbi:MAG TPA: hypothetical protein QF753_11335 [Victivallales bacterium]|nr:hypothetical protein [Victivallales bacterium]